MISLFDCFTETLSAQSTEEPDVIDRFDELQIRELRSFTAKSWSMPLCFVWPLPILDWLLVERHRGEYQECLGSVVLVLR